jgi:hypothetical protein
MEGASGDGIVADDTKDHQTKSHRFLGLVAFLHQVIGYLHR